MFTKRYFQSIVLTGFLAFVGAEVRAEPILLVEIHQIGGRNNLSYPGQPIYLSFGTAANPAGEPGDQSVLDGNYDSSDVGMTFSATPDVVEKMEFNLRQATGGFWLDGLSRTPVGHGADDLWQSGMVVDISLTQFVPRLGFGLTGYELTSVTQTIDRIEYRTTGINAHVADQEQTIRLYGHAIPEPSAFVLLLSGFQLLILRPAHKLK
jgi:hypothetical protein